MGREEGGISRLVCFVIDLCVKKSSCVLMPLFLGVRDCSMI